VASLSHAALSNTITKRTNILLMSYLIHEFTSYSYLTE